MKPIAKLLAVALLFGITIEATSHAAPRATAQQLARAKQVFQAATAAYDQGRYADAMAAFGRAHELSKNPVLYFNLAACAEKMGQPAVAAAHLRAYLTEVPHPDDAESVRERLGALEERARQDEQRRLDEEQRQQELERRLKEQAIRAEAARATPPPSTPPRPQVRSSVGRRYLGGFVALGATLGLGAITAGLGASSLVEYRRLNDECGAAGCGDRVDPVRRQAIAADVFLGLTAAAGVTTIVLFAVEARARDRVVADARGVGVRF